MAMKKKAAGSKTKAKPKTQAKPKARAKPKAIGEAAMMALWHAAMTPSDAHARLMPMVGTWRATTTFTVAPGAPPQVHSGTSVHRLVLGGRFLEQVYRGMAMGMPFEGIGYTGYDNVQKRYVGSWMDTFGTGMTSSLGTGRPTDEKIDFIAESIEPSGKKKVFDTTIRIRGHEHHSYEMWTKGPSGKSYRAMLVEYERG